MQPSFANFLLLGSLTGTPSVLSEPCEFDSCPTGSPAVGFNASNPRLNYVNSYPATAMSYGIRTLAPQFFGGAPDFAVSGPNTVGRNKALYPTPSQQLTRFRKPGDRCPFCRDHRCGGRGNEWRHPRRCFQWRHWSGDSVEHLNAFLFNGVFRAGNHYYDATAWFRSTISTLRCMAKCQFPSLNRYFVLFCWRLRVCAKQNLDSYCKSWHWVLFETPILALLGKRSALRRSRITIFWLGTLIFGLSFIATAWLSWCRDLWDRPLAHRNNGREYCRMFRKY